MPKKSKRVKLRLTPAQRAQIKKLFGHDVPNLVAFVEESTVESEKKTSLRVLRIESIGQVKGLGSGGSVN